MDIIKLVTLIRQGGTLNETKKSILWPLGTIIFTDQWFAIEYLTTKLGFTFAYTGD